MKSIGTWKISFCLGTLLFVCQLGLVLSAVWSGDFQTSLSRLYCWDSEWYSSILENGYRSTIPPEIQQKATSNVAFFPGYVMSASIFYKLGVSSKWSLIISSLVFAWVFWTLFSKVIWMLSESYKMVLFCSGLFLLYPFSYYLVFAYSESLYLSAFLGFWIYSRQASQKALVISSLAGFVMTSTRLVGLPLILVNTRWNLASVCRVVVSACGAGLFFMFCHLKWGQWNLYFVSQELSWNLKSDYFAIFSSQTWMLPQILSWQMKDWNMVLLNHFTMTLFLWAFVAVVWLTVLWSKNWSAFKNQVDLIYAMGISLFVVVSGLSTKNFQSSSRYMLPILVMLFIWISGHFKEFKKWNYKNLNLSERSLFLLVLITTIVSSPLIVKIWNFQKFLIQLFVSGYFIA